MKLKIKKMDELIERLACENLTGKMDRAGTLKKYGFEASPTDTEYGQGEDRELWKAMWMREELIKEITRGLPIEDGRELAATFRRHGLVGHILIGA